jgi:hypothetical protein
MVAHRIDTFYHFAAHCSTLQRYAFLRIAFLPCATVGFPTDSGGHT